MSCCWFVCSHASACARRAARADAAAGASDPCPQPASAAAQVQLAAAQLAQARLNLERTTVVAPADGVVSRRSVELGQIVQPGQPIMAITSLGDVWVTANFKETQLREIQTGQAAEVSVDAFGGRSFRAHVDSLAAATQGTLPSDLKAKLDEATEQWRAVDADR